MQAHFLKGFAFGNAFQMEIHGQKAGAFGAFGGIGFDRNHTHVGLIAV